MPTRRSRVSTVDPPTPQSRPMWTALRPTSSYNSRVLLRYQGRPCATVLDPAEAGDPEPESPGVGRGPVCQAGPPGKHLLDVDPPGTCAGGLARGTSSDQLSRSVRSVMPVWA